MRSFPSSLARSIHNQLALQNSTFTGFILQTTFILGRGKYYGLTCGQITYLGESLRKSVVLIFL